MACSSCHLAYVAEKKKKLVQSIFCKKKGVWVEATLAGQTGPLGQPHPPRTHARTRQPQRCLLPHARAARARQHCSIPASLAPAAPSSPEPPPAGRPSPPPCASSPPPCSAGAAPFCPARRSPPPELRPAAVFLSPPQPPLLRLPLCLPPFLSAQEPERRLPPLLSAASGRPLAPFSRRRRLRASASRPPAARTLAPAPASPPLFFLPRSAAPRFSRRHRRAQVPASLLPWLRPPPQPCTAAQRPPPPVFRRRQPRGPSPLAPSCCYVCRCPRSSPSCSRPSQRRR